MPRRLTRVGINAVFLAPGLGGMETYVRRLVPELLALRPDVRFSLFLSARGTRLLAGEPWIDQLEVVSGRSLGVPKLSALSEVLLVGGLARRRGLDLLHSTAMLGPMRPRLAHVVTVPDLIWLHHPETLGRATVLTWRLLAPPVARRADRLVAFSEAAREEIVAGLGVSADRIDAVALGPGRDPSAAPATPEPELRARLGLGDRPLILSVSAKKAHKNLIRLVQAMADVPDATLVIPGAPTAYEADLRAEAARLGVDERVRLPGYVSGEDLEGLYKAATGFVLASMREGFGLPILEAMRRGVPVACSDRSALPEVAGAAARYFDPESVGDISAAIAALLRETGGRERMVRTGRERAGEFTWRRTAEGTWEAYERALAARGEG